jgi:hypothetical protein
MSEGSGLNLPTRMAKSKREKGARERPAPRPKMEARPNYFTDSNLDWGQDLKPLKGWMDRNAVTRINLAYFGSADPAYYHIDCTYMPGSPFFVPNSSIGRPQLPGYVAVSETVLSGVYFDERGRAFYRGLRDRAPIAHIGHSIRVYWVERPWW